MALATFEVTQYAGRDYPTVQTVLVEADHYAALGNGIAFYDIDRDLVLALRDWKEVRRLPKTNSEGGDE
jgi:hypothetical protein